MAATTGSLETFANALSSVDFFGKSNLNPNNMQNNCVSVSVAHLDYYRDVYQLWDDLYRKPLEDKPLGFPDIKKLLERTKYKYKWSRYDERKTASGSVKSAYEVFLDKFDRDDDTDCQMLFLYTRRSAGGGHCVNLYYAPDWEGDPEHIILDFMDFQHDARVAGGGNKDFKADVQDAQTIFTLRRGKFLDDNDELEWWRKKRAERRNELGRAGLLPLPPTPGRSFAVLLK